MLNEESYFEEEKLVNLELLSKIIKKHIIKDKLEQTIKNFKTGLPRRDAPRNDISIPQVQSSQDTTPQVALDQQLMELL